MADDPSDHRGSTQGRPSLQRIEPDAAVQPAAFDLGAVPSRRRLLTLLGLGAAAAGLTACGAGSVAPSTASTGAVASASASASTSGGADEIPEETAGPYPGDGSNGPDVLEQSGIVRSDIRSSFGTATGSAQGVPMTLELTITDLVNSAPFKGAAVYVWHCDREGRYSLYSSGVTDQNYLRGVQVASTDGVVRFTSIFPACYSGRWPHIHFEVYPDQASITDSTKAIATSQVALPKNTCDQVYAQPGYQQSVTNLARVSLTSDNVFGDDGGVHELGTVTGNTTSGYTVSLAVGVDTTTSPGGGQLPGAPRGG
ncbi:intradiol ring-cleavage dioxygenase [Frankia sp. AgB1.9]|uniref:intradiol ring-cleavage dioxygenase n=1 Tax=unclassified Frankia TaxID=2632575 RepID=UPI0019320C67|nr:MULTISPECIES: intradiol ring-cleavage dioxygenase [unclassified Frankia]MBL7494676.1 intradiol ring-cleavage dioxygenase [Frankia sp. AgW1.1]MBL7553647.1 intradiol ring-cleavage dioxygenase [Frankia sp. AgB1.9]MBL7617661.1 intradiol ring-cleavage dioxygenase [Frankia sp. AgB1.8]